MYIYITYNNLAIYPNNIGRPEADCKKNSSVVRQTIYIYSASRHNGDLYHIPLIPYSAVIYEGFQRFSYLCPHDAERHQSLDQPWV